MPMKNDPSSGPVDPPSHDITAQAIAESSVFKSDSGFSDTVLLTASIARRIVVPWSPSPTALSSFDSIS